MKAMLAVAVPKMIALWAAVTMAAAILLLAKKTGHGEIIPFIALYFMTLYFSEKIAGFIDKMNPSSGSIPDEE